MTIKEYVKGDIVTMLNNSLDGVVQENLCVAHGCNCFMTQRSGIAGRLREFPEVFKADLDYGIKGDKRKLGTFSEATFGRNHSLVTVFNLYTQHRYGRDPKQTYADYDAIGHCFSKLNKFWDAVFHEGVIPTLYIPRIGAGLAGGDWDTISGIIDESAKSVDIIVVDYVKGIDPRLDIVKEGK